MSPLASIVFLRFKIHTDTFCFHQETPHDKKTIKTEETESALLTPEQEIKHPLQNKWALWFFKNDKTKSWADNLRVITAFDTVEDFWA